MIAGLLLAAGGARRFGSQKLVSLLDGVPLVRRSADALAAGTDELIVVVGNESDLVRKALIGLPACVVENKHWQTGMASSLACGIGALPPAAEAVVVALGDQPGIDPAVIHRVIDTWQETAKPIVVAEYVDGRGHPVLFARSMFEELLSLSGDRGAKALIERSTDRLAVVEVKERAPKDVDTEEDLRTWTA